MLFRLAKIAAGVVVAGIILIFIVAVMIYGAMTRTYIPPAHVDISKREWTPPMPNGSSLWLPLNISDDYWNYAEDIQKKVHEIESAHPDWCITRKWIAYRDRSFMTDPFIGGVELDYTIRTSQQTSARTRTTTGE